MNITTRALKLADAAIALAKISTNRSDDIRMHDEALAVVREALKEQREWVEPSDEQIAKAWRDADSVRSSKDIFEFLLPKNLVIARAVLKLAKDLNHVR